MIGKQGSRKFVLAILATFWSIPLLPVRGQEKSGQDQTITPLATWPPGYHQQLRTWIDSQGHSHPMDSLDAWRERRRQLKAGVEAVMGAQPARDDLPPLNIQIIERQSRPLHERLTITFTTEKAERWTAYLFIPNQASAESKRPGILALHPTNAIGKGVTDGQSEAPNRAYGRELADKGYVVIAPDYPSFGDHKQYDFENDAYESGTMKAIMVHMRAMDVLCARDDVDANKLAAIGHSLGGHNAIFVGMFDERIKAVVTSCGWCPFPTYYQGRLPDGLHLAICLD